MNLLTYLLYTFLESHTRWSSSAVTRLFTSWMPNEQLQSINAKTLHSSGKKYNKNIQNKMVSKEKLASSQKFH